MHDYGNIIVVVELIRKWRRFIFNAWTRLDRGVVDSENFPNLMTMMMMMIESRFHLSVTTYMAYWPCQTIY